MKNFFIFFNKINYLVGSDRRKLLWLVPLFLISSILDLIGIGLIVSFISILINGETLEFLNFVSFQDDLLTSNEVIVGFSCALILLFLLKALTSIYVNKTILKICFNYGVRLRSYLIYLYQGMSYSDYASRNSSEYVFSVQTLAGQFSISIVQSILRIMSEGFVGILILLYLAANMGVAFYIFLPLLLVSGYFYDKAFKKKNNEYGLTVNSSSKMMIQSIQEAMHGYKENHIYGITGYFNKLVHSFSKKLALARVKSTVIVTSSRYFIELVVITFISLVAIISVLLGKDTIYIVSTITMFGVASLRLMPSIVQILVSFGNIRYGKNSVDKLFYDVQKFSNGMKDFNNYEVDENHTKNSAHKITQNFESLELQKVDFSYFVGGESILKNINLTVNQGEMIGIIGSSGSGKTTIMDLLLCFLKPSNGEILYNKSSIVSNVTEWTSQVAYLPQEVFILDDSLKCNIALGVEESQINDEQVEVAIKQSRLEGLVIKLDNGLDTFIGERGVRLSGGERQRIALARALYHKRDVLFLDESTSSLDMETEKQILSEIKSLKGHKTFVIIAHNYATLKYCDVIYEVIDKELVPRGRYEDIKSK